MRIIVLLVLAALCPGFALAQKEGNIWYFGGQAGLDFNSGSPQAITDSKINTFEGCATLCDASGQLLFYTDGIKIWDRTHTVMPNGGGLKGDPSSTQSGIIVPRPGSSTKFFVFTVDKESGAKGLCYSELDLTQNGGKGDVIQKNVTLEAPVAEKLTAVQHANKVDVWVIAHKWNSSDFIAYLVTPSGINTTPVVSKGKLFHGGDKYNSIGYLKLSPDGSKLASVITSPNGQGELAQFNNQNGSITNFILLDKLDNPYGVEFSPNNSRLYIASLTRRKIFQYDATLTTQAAVEASRKEVGTALADLGGLQLGPDKKIYVARNTANKLGVITKPDEEGGACLYVDEAISLKNRTSYMGLPTFIQSFFAPVTGFTYDLACAGTPVKFFGKSNDTPEEWRWNFGDPGSGQSNFSTDKEPSHNFSPGQYTVTLVVKVRNVYDTVQQVLKVGAMPKVNLGKDQVICANQPVRLNAGNPGMKYRWSTGDTSREIQTMTSGKVWVEVTNGTCSASDTVYLTFAGSDIARLGKDTVVCKGSVVILRKRQPGGKALWNTGDTASSLKVTSTGMYILTVTLGQCVYSDSQFVFFVPAPEVNLGEDFQLCEGDADTLDAGQQGSSYLWNTGATTRRLPITKGGKYIVSVTNGTCVTTDTINVWQCKAVVYAPDAFSPNGDKMNDTFRILGTDIAKGTLSIYNRWGQIIYTTDNYAQGWDGKVNEDFVPSDFYMYTFVYWDHDKEVLYHHVMRGKIWMMR